ncbi:MAG: hypothetical protein DRQ02_08400, partial [Candidatus Latescibacterota bacterium]
IEINIALYYQDVKGFLFPTPMPLIMTELWQAPDNKSQIRDNLQQSQFKCSERTFTEEEFRVLEFLSLFEIWI